MEFISIQKPCNYDHARILQMKWLTARIHNQCADRILFLEHTPCITRGRGLQFHDDRKETHKPFLKPKPLSLPYFQTERGGDLTAHEPGQLVIYPIVKLDGEGFSERHDINSYLRKLESTISAVLKTYHVKAEKKQTATGVWVDDRKLVSAGIAIRKWVTWHGIAMNVINSLESFNYISPCGFDPKTMIRLVDLLSPNDQAKLMSAWREQLENHFLKAFVQVSLVKPTTTNFLQFETIEEAFEYSGMLPPSADGQNSTDTHSINLNSIQPIAMRSNETAYKEQKPLSALMPVQMEDLFRPRRDSNNSVH